MKKRNSGKEVASMAGARRWQDWWLSRERFFQRDAEAGEEYILPYEGELISAVVVDAIGGYYKPGYSAGEALCRANDGRYFLVREVERYWCWRQDKGVCGWGCRRFTLPADHQWLRVKKLTFQGALAYVTRSMDESFRADVNAAIQGKL